VGINKPLHVFYKNYQAEIWPFAKNITNLLNSICLLTNQTKWGWAKKTLYLKKTCLCLSFSSQMTTRNQDYFIMERNVGLMTKRWPDNCKRPIFFISPTKAFLTFNAWTGENGGRLVLKMWIGMANISRNGKDFGKW